MKRSCLVVLLMGVVVRLLTSQARAQTASTPPDSAQQITRKHPKPRPLFASDSVKVFTLTTDLRTLLKDRNEGTSAVPATLTFLEKNQVVQLPLTVKVRGHFRRKRVNCSFPPLLLDLPKKAARHTLFAHQNKLKLVTHCQDEEWVVREFLVYKLYNQLTDLSFQVQLARVTYADSTRKRASETHWGVLLEDDKDLAKRNQTKISAVTQTSMGYVDSLQMATVAVFAYMIGNVDWSIPYRHNICLLGNDGQRPWPVPYDFDHAGIVEASYALPPEQLGVRSVRERVYRGIIYPVSLFKRVFATYLQAKPYLYALYQNDPRLNKLYVKRTLKYLDEFYALISQPEVAVSRFAVDVR